MKRGRRELLEELCPPRKRSAQWLAAELAAAQRALQETKASKVEVEAAKTAKEARDLRLDEDEARAALLAGAGREALSAEEVLVSSVLHLLGQFSEPFLGSFEDLCDLVRTACARLGVADGFSEVNVRTCLNVFIALGLVRASAANGTAWSDVGALDPVISSNGHDSSVPLGLLVRPDQDEVLSDLDAFVARLLQLESFRERLLEEEESTLRRSFLEEPEVKRNVEDGAHSPRSVALSAAAAAAAAVAAASKASGETGLEESSSSSVMKGEPAINGDDGTVRDPENKRSTFFLPSSVSILPRYLERELEEKASVSNRNANASIASQGLMRAATGIFNNNCVPYSATPTIEDAMVAARLQRARSHINRVKDVIFQHGPQAFERLHAERMRSLQDSSEQRPRSASLDEALGSIHRSENLPGQKARIPKFLPDLKDFIGFNNSVDLSFEIETEPLDFADIAVQFRLASVEETRSVVSPLARVKSARSLLDERSSSASAELLRRSSSITATIEGGEEILNFENAAKQTADGTNVDLPSWRVHDWRLQDPSYAELAQIDALEDETFLERHKATLQEAKERWDAELEQEKKMKEEERIRRQILALKSKTPRERKKSTTSSSSSTRPPASSSSSAEKGLKIPTVDTIGKKLAKQQHEVLSKQELEAPRQTRYALKHPTKPAKKTVSKRKRSTSPTDLQGDEDEDEDVEPHRRVSGRKRTRKTFEDFHRV